MTSRRRALAFLAIVWLIRPVGAASAEVGDVMVAAYFASQVVRVDPLSGAQTVISAGGLLDTPTALAVEADGRLLVTDTGTFSGVDALVRIDPVTGTQTRLATFEGSPLDVAVEPSESILVAILFEGIYRVPRAGGTPELVAPYNDDCDTVHTVAVQSNGSIFMGGSDQVCRVVGGVVTPLHVGVPLESVVDLFAEDGGTLLVADGGSSGVPAKIFRLNATTGTPTELFRGNLYSIDDFEGVSVEPDGGILVIENERSVTEASLIRLRPDLSSGYEVVSEDGDIDFPEGLDVVRSLPEPDGSIAGVLAVATAFGLRLGRRAGWGLQPRPEGRTGTV
jgi:DNA-binding beta-propeller fold protein YncE